VEPCDACQITKVKVSAKITAARGMRFKRGQLSAPGFTR